MPHCVFQKTDAAPKEITSGRWAGRIEHIFVCVRCGFVATSFHDAERIFRECPAPDVDRSQLPELPPLFKRLKTFSWAAIRHALNGSPACSQEEINVRLAICRACPFYRPSEGDPEIGNCAHKNCGCNVGREDRYLNKLAWRDQQCPDDPPRWGRLD